MEVQSKVENNYSKMFQSGLAVFESLENEKYKLFSREWRENDSIIISGYTIDGTWYDLVWFNGAQTECAEIIYTVDGEVQDPIIHDTKEMDIFINEASSKDYKISVVYYDRNGNKYE